MKKTDKFTLSRRELLTFGLASAATGGLGLTISGPVQAKTAVVNTKAHIVIIGAGAGGLALANRLVKQLQGGRITLIDPRADHYYQPGLSLVGAGLKPASYVVSKTADWVSAGIDFIPEAAAAIDPESNTVSTTSGKSLRYDFLVVAPGLVLDNEAIEGFSLDLIGQHGIGGLYAGPEYAARTWQAASQFIEKGGVAISTRPATEMKCAGAPLKHTFLIDDRASRGPKSQGYEMHYACPQPVLFSVPIVAEKVRMLYGQRGIQAHLQHTLKAIDPGRKIATFATSEVNKTTGEAVASTVEMPYDYLHVIQPQRAPAVIRESGLSWANRWVDQGWVECDPRTLRHLRFPNIFALGDVAGIPKGKTAASVKWQTPVVADHLIAAIQEREGTLFYDGYTSCPLITRVGQAMLVEFDYHNNLLPSFPGLIAPLEELWLSWLMKVWALKPTYNAMLQGKA
ncbi:NAD(P)/FAD-dependent oxidoreductase [Advenella sp. RU8]|uniref:NAD(P)/FAD-dependent oxidoreductase n=1 Tax=Advenella sp. RU8 TaxID=3399575 RepID=UPI003AADA961